MLVKRINSGLFTSQIVLCLEDVWSLEGPQLDTERFCYFRAWCSKLPECIFSHSSWSTCSWFLWEDSSPRSLTSGPAVVCLDRVPLRDTWPIYFRGTLLQLILSARAVCCQVAVRGSDYQKLQETWLVFMCCCSHELIVLFPSFFF